MKQILVTTADRFARLQRDLDKHTVCGFDTEAVGPARRYSQARAKPFLNVCASYLQGMSVAFPNGNAYYLPLRHRGPNAKWAWAEELVSSFEEFDRVWCHNVKFDTRMLFREGFHDSVNWFDSMLTAWIHFSRSSGLGLKALAKELLDRESPEWEGSLIDKTASEVLDYVCHDALNTLEVGELLFPKLTDKQRNWALRVEFQLAELLGRSEEEGVPLNVQKLTQTLGKRAHENRERLEEEWATYATHTGPEGVTEVLNPGSAKQLQVLFEEGFWAELGRTKDGLFKTGKDVLKYNSEHAQTPEGRRAADVCLELRKALKAQGTYMEGFYEELRQWPDRRLHPEQNQLGARTTRFSSANPNIQNQISKGEYAPLLRECYEAPAGWSYISADFAQQEPRIFAELAGKFWARTHGGDHGALHRIFIEGKDLHQEVANAIGFTRDNAKTFNMGFMMYGGSPFKAAKEFGWTREEARAQIARAFKQFPESPAFRDYVIGVTESREPWPHVRIASGHLRYVPELVPHRWMREQPLAWAAKRDSLCEKYGIDKNDAVRVDKVMRSSGERIALNTIIQGSGAAMTKLAMVRFDRATSWRDIRIVFMTHDSITAVVREGWEVQGKQLLQEAMEGAAIEMGYKVPFIAEPSDGKTWVDLK